MKHETMYHFERVIDWHDRIKDYSEDLKKEYYHMFEIEKEYDALLVDKTLNWKVCHDSKKKGSELRYE